MNSVFCCCSPLVKIYLLCHYRYWPHQADMTRGNHFAQTHHLCCLQFTPPAFKIIMQVAYILKTGNLVTISFVTASYFSFEVISPVISVLALSIMAERDAICFPHLPLQFRPCWRYSSVQLSNCTTSPQFAIVMSKGYIFLVPLKVKKRKRKRSKWIIKPKSSFLWSIS